VERFLAIEAASGIVLMGAAAAALLWANSPWREAYARVHDLHFWINEGLMTLFFFVVGLEIRLEMHSGELNSVRRAALPLAGALGGMLVPALIFLVLNVGRESAAGWAVPMATDIAFAVGALALLGSRIPAGVRVFLLAIAVIDDIGAIVVIALFYSGELVPAGFVVLASGIAAIFVMQLIGFRSAVAYVIPALITWAGAYHAGIHPALAGVIVGLMTPVKEVSGLQDALERWVAFGIIPLFAFANAGVSLGQIGFRGDGAWAFWGIFLGLTAGKPIGILGFSWLAARLEVVTPPRIGWNQMALAGLTGGIGFTMSLFIAQLAFPGDHLLETAKFAIVCGSAVSGLLSIATGYTIPMGGFSKGADRQES